MERAIKWLMLILIIAEIVLVRAGLLDVSTAIGVVVGIEALLLIVAGRQIIVAVRRYRQGRAAGLNLRIAIEDGLTVLLPRKVARIVALEPLLWAYLGKWALRHNHLGQGEFQYHKRSPIGPLLLVILFTTPVEILLFELLIPWDWLRWLLLIAAAYALFWAFAFYASLVVLPHRLEQDGVRLRYGIFADTLIPYPVIERVELQQLRSPSRGEGLRVDRENETAHITIGGRTSVTLHLRAPCALNGLLNLTPPVRTVYVAADDPEGLTRELTTVLRPAQ
jgi:hypothetical protein